MLRPLPTLDPLCDTAPATAAPLCVRTQSPQHAVPPVAEPPLHVPVLLLVRSPVASRTGISFAVAAVFAPTIAAQWRTTHAEQLTLKLACLLLPRLSVFAHISSEDGSKCHQQSSLRPLVLKLNWVLLEEMGPARFQLLVLRHIEMW